MWKFLRIPTEDERWLFFRRYQASRRTGAYMNAYKDAALLCNEPETSEQVAVQMPPQVEQNRTPPRQTASDIISRMNTKLMPAMEQPMEQRKSEGQQVVHITSSFDIRAIGLPDIIDRQIKRHLEQFGTYPDAILLNAESIGFLRERGLTRGDGEKEEIIYRGIFKLRVDKTLPGVKVAFGRSELAS